ncbi:MAG: alpha/beta hydrolase [Syntrophomonadaceae bacterium]|nr:alpha/beta hydrolase [Syntrophomonadaceae bacterium]
MEAVTITNPITHMRLAALLAVPPQPRMLLIACHGFRGGKENAGRIYGLGADLNAIGIGLLAFDFSGSGQSEGSFDTMTLSRQASDLKAVMSWARANYALPLVLLGRSFGGSTVIAGGAEDKAVAGYVLWSTPVWLEQTFAAILPDAYCRLKNGQRIEIQQDGDCYALGPEMAADLSVIDLHAALDAIGDRPVLIVHARDDEVVAVANALELKRHLPQARLHLFDRAGHKFIEHSAERQALTIEWLRSTFGEA